MFTIVSKAITAAFLIGTLMGCGSSSSDSTTTSNSASSVENGSVAANGSEVASPNTTGDVTSGPSWTADGVTFQGDFDSSQQILDSDQISTSIRTVNFNFGSNVNVESLFAILSSASGTGNYTLVASALDFIDALRNSPGSPVAFITVVVDSNQGGNATWNSATGTVSATIMGDDVYHYSTSEPLTLVLNPRPGSENSDTPQQIQVTVNNVFGMPFR